MRLLAKSIFGLWLLLSWMLMPPAAAQQTASSGAVITGLVGSASHRAVATDKPSALQPFQQLFTDDLVELSSGSVATIVFFSGRKETWEGPVKLRILENNSKPLDDPIAKPLREEIPSDVQQDLQSLPEVMGNSRAAVTIVLAPNPPGMPVQMDCRNWQRLELTAAEQSVLQTARIKYETMRNQTADYDHTPEAYLISVLAQYDQFDEIAPLLDTLQSRYPGTSLLQTFRDRVARCKPYLQPAG